MKTIKDYSKVEPFIVSWLTDYLKKSKQKGFVIGVSGGIDSAVVSTLAAKTGFPLTILEMPIHQGSDQVSRAKNHIDWLKQNFPNNVDSFEVSMETEATNFPEGLKKTLNIYDMFINNLKMAFPGYYKINTELSEANTRSRFRMIMLYFFAGLDRRLVLGTGNKVEDFGIGFFTKYGDGGVDLSPIGKLMKSEVYALGKYMGVNEDILQARPTDGLWGDNRTDEDQIGASYDELEWAMDFLEKSEEYISNLKLPDISNLTKRQKEVIEIYITRHEQNKHKMDAIPVCPVDSFKE